MWFRTHALRVRYPAQERWAVDGVDVEIRPGMVTWLSGALGSGTSTLLLALAGLAPRLTGGKREGDVMADDDDSATLAPLRSGIAYLGPSPALQLSGIAETVRDEIAVGPMNLGEPREKIAAATDRAIGRLRLSLTARRARSPAEKPNGCCWRHCWPPGRAPGCLTNHFPRWIRPPPCKCKACCASWHATARR